MIHNLVGIRNSFVLVLYDYEFKTIILQSNRTDEIQYFAEYADMYELYNTFKEEFTDDTDYDTAFNYFKPIEQ